MNNVRNNVNVTSKPGDVKKFDKNANARSSTTRRSLQCTARARAEATALGSVECSTGRPRWPPTLQCFINVFDCDRVRSASPARFDIA
jgi:hypothetical protein